MKGKEPEAKSCRWLREHFFNPRLARKREKILE
jgi:hypothetical protein